ncbi:hypothetical protein KSP39_PZI002052 [Platanthera zijinensis]|uniref:RNase H type-1 domain-containing protein n=1 Tax=Platanthera zijinensis TaxID=2320716 RepID=A0AAP0C050_9ASPA
MPSLVAEFLDQNYNWIPQKLLITFGEGMVEDILGLSRENIGGPDRLIWAHSEKSVMASSIIYSLESPRSTLIGEEIWKIKSQPRFLMMIWRAINDMLPTNYNMYQRRLRQNADCPRGCGQSETIEHIFGSCSFMARIKVILGKMNFHFSNDLLEDLLEELHINRKSIKIKLLASLIYRIWKARNQFVHSEQPLSPSSIVLNAILDASDGNWATHVNLDTSWLPPPLGWLKVNFDGSVHPNNYAGLGCTIRNHTGELLAASGARIQSRSVNMTELRSALHGTSLAKDYLDNLIGVIVEGDSDSAIAALNRILSGFYDGEVETKLASCLKDLPKVAISQIDRRANSAADYVANMACSSNFWWERGMPLTQALSFILSKDCSPL